MTYKILILAAAVSLSAGLAACSSDKPEGSLPSAKPAAESAPADEGMAAEDMAAENMTTEGAAAAPAPAGEMTTEETVTEETTTEEVSPEGAVTEDTTTETMTTDEAVQQAAYEERINEHDMLRDVRDGSYAIRYCESIDDVNLKTFNDCVTTQLGSAENDGKLTDSYKLGADYQAWVFLGEHADQIQEKGYEWSKEYRQIFASRALYKKSVQNLIYKTGLPPDEVCDQLRADCPEK